MPAAYASATPGAPDGRAFQPEPEPLRSTGPSRPDWRRSCRQLS
jgi:hypothetical protein